MRNKFAHEISDTHDISYAQFPTLWTKSEIRAVFARCGFLRKYVPVEAHILTPGQLMETKTGSQAFMLWFT